jgi:CheY-like chemotaxis protein
MVAALRRTADTGGSRQPERGVPSQGLTATTVQLRGEGGALKVLLIDDNEIYLEVSEAALSALGFKVVKSGSALGFTAAMAQTKPDIALVDVLMPAINGNHLVEIARRRQRRRTGTRSSTGPANVPECLFILNSNLPDADLQTLAARCGAQGYIRKSSRPGAIGDHLCAFLRQQGITPPTPVDASLASSAGRIR